LHRTPPFASSRVTTDAFQETTKGFKSEIQDAITQCQKEKDEIGDLPTTPEEERQFLVNLGTKFHELCILAVLGMYANSAFFGTGFSAHPEAEARFLRSRIQNLNMTFARITWAYSHHIEIEGSNFVPDNVMRIGDAETHFDNCRELPMQLTRMDTILQWVRPVAERTRGMELDDGRNPFLVKGLFDEQSKKWETLAQRHLDECSESCRTFLRLVLEHVVGGQDLGDYHQVLHKNIELELENRLAEAKKELKSIMEDFNSRFPITVSYLYAEGVAEARARRSQKAPSNNFVNPG